MQTKKIKQQKLSNKALLYAIFALFITVLYYSCDKDTDKYPESRAAFNDKTVFFDETASEAELTGKEAASVSIDNKRYYIGTAQVSANNQNPIIMSFEAGNPVIVYSQYERAAPDGRGLGLATDGKELYAVFLVDGGTYETPFFTDYTQNGWIASYGSGGGAKVSVILKIKPEDCSPLNEGTFVIAKKQDGNTSSLVITNLVISSNKLTVHADSWYSPLDTDKQPMEVSGSSPFSYELTLSKDLSEALDARLL